MRPSGTIAWGNQLERDFAAMDYTAGMHTYLTRRHWGCGHGEADDGTPLAINITAGSAPDNDSACWWVGSRLQRGPACRFAHLLPPQEWMITCPDGLPELCFEPVSSIRVASIVSLLCQPQGTFTGSLPDAAGQPLTIGWMSGVAEIFRAHW